MAGILILVGIGVIIGAPFLEPDKPETAILFEALSVPLTVIWIITLRAGLRLRWVEFVLDERSIREEKLGEMSWEVPWSQFNGVTPGRMRMANVFLNHVKVLNVINAHEEVVGEILLSSADRVGYKKFLRELVRRSKIEYPETEPVNLRVRRTPLRCLVMTAAGALICFFSGASIIYHRNRSLTEEWPYEGILPHYAMMLWGIPLAVGVGLVAGGVIGLVLLKNPYALDGGRAMLAPGYGPTLADFKLDARGKPQPVTFEPGIVYAYVHPEAIEHELRSARGAAVFFMVTSIVIGLPALWAVIFDAKSRIAASFCLLIFTFSGWLGSVLWRRTSPLCQTVGDRFQLLGEKLQVFSNGEKKEFPNTGKTRTWSKLVGNTPGGCLDRYGEEGTNYHLDPRYLIVLDPRSPADVETPMQS